MDEFLNYISITGAFAFAISGALTAMNNKFDPFGVLIIAFATAVGGGTMRDILIEGKPVFWLYEPGYLYFIIAGTIFAILFRAKLNYMLKPLFFFDTIGLALYTVIGVQVGLEYNLNYINCIILGTLTGAFGGVIRDILVNEVPVIFKKEIYATVSIVGGALYLVLDKLILHHPVMQFIPMVFIIVLRLLIVRYKISLPTLYKKE
jgi:uncharacterized membrane protein YeiH